jgi:outer membrane protein assembly factor BamB
MIFSHPFLSRLRGSGSRALACILLLSLTACSGFSWNPANWFSSDEVNSPAELQEFTSEVSLRREWNVNVGNGQGGTYTELTPAIDGGAIYAVSANGNVVAVDLDSGDLIWRTRLGTAVTGGVGAGAGLVMLGTENGELVVFNQNDGEIKWRSRVTSEILSPPQTNGDIVVAMTVDDKLVALDAETGVQRWIYETTTPVLSLRGTSRPVITSAGSVIAGFSNGTLVAVEAENGIYLWEERLAVPEGRYDIERVIDVDGDLVLDGSRVLASSYQGNVMALDVATGRIVWGMEASSYHGMARGFGNIYYCDDRSYIVAVRDNSTDTVWQNEDLQYRQITAPTAVNNFVAVADYEGYVHLLSQIDGRIVGRIRVDNDGVRSTILARNGRIYVYGNSGRLTALSLQ